MDTNAANALSRDDVRWCYETLLKRTPENEDVVTHFVENVPDLKSLMRLFLESSEFNTIQKKNAANSLSRDDVRWCYETLLKRNPESEDVITHFVDRMPDLRSLMQLFLESSEFNSIQKNVAIVDGSAFEVIDGFRYNDSPSVQKKTLAILQMLEPATVEGYTKIRTGHDGDGGYVSRRPQQHPSSLRT